MMGALVLEIGEGKFLELSGFTDKERTLVCTERNCDCEDRMACAKRRASEYAGKLLPEDIEAVHFPVGKKVTFKYRGLSDDGIPTEARYWRKADEV